MPKIFKIYQSMYKIMPNTKWTLSKWPKLFNYMPKWRNFTKFDHTAEHQSHWKNKFLLLSNLPFRYKAKRRKLSYVRTSVYYFDAAVIFNVCFGLRGTNLKKWLQKIKPNQLFQPSFSARGSSGTSSGLSWTRTSWGPARHSITSTSCRLDHERDFLKSRIIFSNGCIKNV